MKQSRASRSSSPSCIWETGKPTGAVAMITANTNNLYEYQLDNILKWREQFVQLPQFVLKHKLTVLWTKPPDFRRVFVYFWHHVDWLEKLPSKEQQLSRTQHFILKAHAAIFVYTYNTAHAEHRWPLWHNDRIVSYQHMRFGLWNSTAGISLNISCLIAFLDHVGSATSFSRKTLTHNVSSSVIEVCLRSTLSMSYQKTLL